MDEQWWELGACRGENPAVFDGLPRRPGPRPKQAERDWTAAKRLCARCPVQPQCLEYVLSLPDDAWADQSFAAGFTPEQLHEMKSRKRRAS